MQYKLKSKQYLEFIHTKSCIFCGAHKVDAHHEGLRHRFTGSRKKYNDYQAIPVCNDCHINGIHMKGDAFWEDSGRDPEKVVKKLNLEYIETVHPQRFEDEDAYDEELRLVQENIDSIG